MKKMVLIGLLCLMGGLTNAQEYRHGAGVQYNLGLFSLAYTNADGFGGYTGTEGVGVPGLVYKASLGFEVGNVLVSATAYPFIGLMYNSQTGGYFGAELPILCELTLGDPDDACFFVGAGGSAAFLATSGIGSGSILGPQFELGGQFIFRDQVIGAKFAYTYGVNKFKLDQDDYIVTKNRKQMFSLGVYYKFG
ncbi:MAG: hypothetical protein ACI857_002066 [Arenicella sp.]|jgi:hypothetical protein